MDPRRATTWAASSKTFALSILLIVLADAAEARLITVRWSSPDPAAVTGFRVYTRAASQSFGAPAYDGMPTAMAGVYSIPLTVSDVAGTYVTATAYNSGGESSRSNELLFAAPVCGDGILDAGEQCDDGNTNPGDGCSASCTTESPGSWPSASEPMGHNDPYCEATYGKTPAEIEATPCGVTENIAANTTVSACTHNNVIDFQGDNITIDCVKWSTGATPFGTRCEQADGCENIKILHSTITGNAGAGTTQSLLLFNSRIWPFKSVLVEKNDISRSDVLVQTGSSINGDTLALPGEGNKALVIRGNRLHGVTRFGSSVTNMIYLAESPRGVLIEGNLIDGSDSIGGVEVGSLIQDMATSAPAGNHVIRNNHFISDATGDAMNFSGNPYCAAPINFDGNKIDLNSSGLFNYTLGATTCPRIDLRAGASCSGNTSEDGFPMTCAGDGGGASQSVCGNAVLDAGEQCDDGNTTAGDGCNASCRIEACGNAVLDAGEQCDDGNKTAGDGCNATCRIEACGNAVLDAGEQCDDGNKTAGDGCNATCRIEACGNAVLDAGEQCDDGNKTAGDGCNATCRIEACANAVLDAGEQCDDGNTVGGDGCNATCQIEVAACGNGIRESGEACDDGNKTAGDGCNASCQVEACGNAVLDAGEQCDDGNTVGGDGCDAQCSIEVTGGVPYYLEVGGSSWVDPSSGQQWSTDQPYATGGVITSAPGISISRTKLDPLYWTRRVGGGSGGVHFGLPVAGLGPYRVRLHFAELGGEVNASGQRVFDVLLEGGVVGLMDFDVFSAAGGNRSAVVRDLYVLVDDGVLDIDLVPVAGLPPMIAAIEVIEGGAPPASPRIRRR